MRGCAIVAVDFPGTRKPTHVIVSTSVFRRPNHAASQVSHKTCRFYFVLERTNTTLGDYLRRCLESDLVSVMFFFRLTLP